MGVIYGIIRDDLRERFVLGKGRWETIFSDKPALLCWTGKELAAKIKDLGPEHEPLEAAIRILRWANDEPVRLTHDDCENPDWDIPATGSIFDC